MPEDNEIETDWKTEYQKIQRKLSRSNKRNDELNSRIAEGEASSRRTESMVERMLDGDADAEFKEQIKSQREKDTATAQLEVELSSLIEQKDLDFDGDPRLSDARRLVNEFNRTGDTSIIGDIKSMINGIDSIEDAGTETETEQSKIDAAVLADRQAYGRVDTGHTTALNTSQVSRQDLAFMNPKDGRNAMAEKVKQALDQLYGS